MWPGRQVVPDESRCYIPIFDGLLCKGLLKGHFLLTFNSCELIGFRSIAQIWLFKALRSNTKIYWLKHNLKQAEGEALPYPPFPLPLCQGVL